MAFAAGSVQATVLNFISMADGNVYGESGYSSLNIGLVSITATKSSLVTNANPTGSAFAYLDRGTAGLGVCGFVTDLGAQGNSGSNKCLDAAGGSAAGDDNVTTTEALSFVFSEAVTITNIWFNNNHDGGFGQDDIQDLINIEGVNYPALPGIASSTWNMAAGISFDVAFVNEEFYVAAIEFSRQPGGGCTENCSVPEPGVLALLAVGLIAGGLVRRRKHS